MKKFIQPCILLLLLCMAGTRMYSQNSVLVNFGSTTCIDGNNPNFALVKDPLSPTPTVMANCSMLNQLSNFFGVFIAYNPKDNKLYVASIQSGVETKIWPLDIGLPNAVNCPASIPVLPNYSYSYVSNNFEFDNNGDLWSFSTYDLATGLCSIEKFDVNNGNVLSTRVLKFPTGHFPESITSGDLTITPNGRMFATLGQNPSQLYEITGYSGTDTAQAIYLQTMPFNCYGIAYLNGQLEITGTNLVNSCYYFDYDIALNKLGSLKTFQNNLGPIDNSSFTPAVGTTKQLVSANKINATTADLIYDIYVRNMGNVILNNINVTEDLVSAFGAGNVSNVSAAFVAGFNNGGLTLNPGFNGTTQTQVLNANQQLPNNTSKNQDYYFKVRVQCRVSNLQSNITYLNSAVGTAIINNTVNAINISDSSNNGTEAVIDPNNDGNAGGVGENVPTPFNISLLPVHFLNIQANLVNKSKATVIWKVATPTQNALRFEIEYSPDAKNWQTIGKQDINDPHKAVYQFDHIDIPTGNLYYRIRQIDKDGVFIYSSIVLLQNKKGNKQFIVYPNPAKDFIGISVPYDNNDISYVELYDATGRLQLQQPIQGSAGQIDISKLSNGYYVLKLKNGNDTYNQKLLVLH